MTTTDKKTAVIYARVSSAGAVESRQSTERQVIDLTDYAAKNSMTICKTFEEHISGAKRNEERAVLSEGEDANSERLLSGEKRNQ